jgi:hypothetical protein
MMSRFAQETMCGGRFVAVAERAAIMACFVRLGLAADVVYPAKAVFQAARRPSVAASRASSSM